MIAFRQRSSPRRAAAPFRFVRGLLLACLAGVASSCAGDATPCAPAGSTVLRVAVPNPQAPRATPKQIMPPTGLTDLALVVVNDRGVPTPGLATSWSTPDRQTWTLTLRNDLRTHAGVPLTAARIREAMLTKMAGRTWFDPVARDLLRIEAPDPRTLVVHLRRPSTAFLESLSFSGLTAEEGEPELSAGPFRLLESGDTRMDFASFPEASARPGGVSGLSATFYPSARTAWAAFLRHEADFLYDVPPTAASLLAQNPDVQLYPAGGRHVYALGFNLKHARLRDARVRQAINLAIDREEIARSLLGGYGRPAPGPFSQHHWAMEGAGRGWPYDPVAALALLREAGGGRVTPLELICITPKEYPSVAEVVSAMEVQLARVNITLRLVPLDTTAFAARAQSGDFDVVMTPIMVGYGNLWPYIFWHGSAPRPFFRTGYTAADAALDAVYTAPSDEEERRAIREVVEVMRRDPPAAFILPLPIIRAVRRSWHVPPQTADIRDVRRTLSQWTLATPACGASGAS